MAEFIKDISNNNPSVSGFSFFDILRRISHLLLTLAKISMIFISIYYIINFKLYSFTTNVPSVLRQYSIIDYPLSLIESIGMLILIIPCTIIIMSFLHPTVLWLKIMASFSAIGGNIFSLGHLISKGLLEDYFKSFFVTVYNAPSLENKVLLFKEFFNQAINIYTPKVDDALAFQSFVQEVINKNILHYNEILKATPLADISSFSSKLAQQLFTEYQQGLELRSSSISIPSSFLDSIIGGVSYIINHTGHIIILGVACYAFYKTYQNAVILKDATESIMNMGKRLTNAIRGAKETDSMLKETTTNIEGITKQVNNLNQNVATLQTTTQGLSDTVNYNASIMKEGLAHLNVTYNNLKAYINSTQFTSVPSSVSDEAFNISLRLQDQIHSIAKCALTNSNDLKALAIITSGLEARVANILSTPTPKTIIQGTGNEVLAAADRRWMEETRNKLNSFDFEAEIGKAKVTMDEKLKVALQNVNNKVDGFIAEAREQITKNKQIVTDRVKNAESNINQTNVAIQSLRTDINNVNSAQVIKDELQTKLNIETSNNIKQNVEDITTMSTRHNDLEVEVSFLRTNLQTQITAMNGMIMENQELHTKHREEQVTAFQQFRKEVMGMIETTKRVNTDSRNISAGLYSRPSTAVPVYSRSTLGLPHLFTNK